MRAGPRRQAKMRTRFSIGLTQQLPHLSNLLLWSAPIKSVPSGEQLAFGENIHPLGHRIGENVYRIIEFGSVKMCIAERSL